MADIKSRIILEGVDKTKAAFDSATTGLRKVESVTTTLNGTLSRLAPLLGAATFTGLISNAITAADKINDVAKANEVNVGSIIKLAQALSLNGGESQNATKLFSSLTAKIEEAAGGSNAAQAEFKKLGISLKDLATLDGQQLFEKSLSGLQAIEDPIKRNAIAMDVLGKSVKGVDIKGLADDYASNQTDFTDAEKSFKDIGIAMDKLDTFTMNTSKSLAENFGPALLTTITYVDDLVFGFDKLEKNIRAANKAREESSPFKAAPTLKDAPKLGDFNLPDEFKGSGEIREVVDAQAEDNQRKLEASLRRASDLRKKSSQEAIEDLKKEIDFEQSQKEALYDYETKRDSDANKIRSEQDKASAEERLEINNMLYEREQNGLNLQEQIQVELQAQTDELMFQVSIQGLSAEQQKQKIADRNVELGLAKAINDLNQAGVYLNEEETDQLKEKIAEIEKLNGQLEKTDRTGKELGLTFSSAFEDALVDAKDLDGVLQGLGEDLIRIFARKTVTEPLEKQFSGLFESLDFGSFFSGLVPNANGGVYSGAGISSHSGSIVSSPTVFPFAKGVGLMGEAGPEAILPLRRGSDGKLGVQADGGSGSGKVEYNVSISVDATGGNVQGNNQKATDLGRQLEGVVRGVLLKEKRPGGVLA
jgi:hypothetical protein